MERKRKSKDSSKNQKFKKQNINIELVTDQKDFLDLVRKNLTSSETNNTSNEITVINNPFTCLQIRNFIQNKDFVEELEKDLMNLSFNEKSTDLFQFQQSNDLNNSSIPSIKAFREKLFTDGRKFLEDLLQISLDSVTDMSCARYRYTDHLLCHDDELEGRVIAFIYYLVPDDWSHMDGGCLDLFSCDDKLRPICIKESLLPIRNSFTFFQVNEKSFHQVAEVLSETKTRLSISGWFHGKSIKRQERYVDIPKPMIPAVHQENEILLSWINPTYLQPDIVSDIQEQFEEESEIQLTDFLRKEKYEMLFCELQTNESDWLFKGPYHLRCCWNLSEETLRNQTPNLTELMQLLMSKPFFRLLKKLTDLDLCELHNSRETIGEENTKNILPNDKDASNSNPDVSNTAGSSEKIPACSCDVFAWKQGCYTLLTDSKESEEFQLDAFLHFQCEGWVADDMGGATTYISADTDEELLRVEPLASNCLSLVYRDSNTSRFTNYVNSKSENRKFYSIEATYIEG